ncbi:MAG: xanthine dehydrogenase family protein subunit M [Gemmatimonadetes bacterium]|nr:xanthine dehydrogenase family protein subunit M [Gemmatimonadota bacterium]
MVMPDFTYVRPDTLTDACALAARLGRDGAFIAGGTELIPDFHRARESARHLIALDHLAELRGIAADGDGLCIGALTTVAEVAASPLVRARFVALADAARAIGSAQIRSLATIGGNFCRAVSCADTPPAAIAGEARVRLAGVSGTRELAAEAFFLGARRTALAPGEVMVAITLPAQPASSGTSYQRFSRRKGAALAVAAVAARVTLAGGRIAGARIVLGAVSPAPLLVTLASAMLVNERPSATLFAGAAEQCADEALPITDVRGSADFRRELVRVLARRALDEAAARAAEWRS